MGCLTFYRILSSGHVRKLHPGTWHSALMIHSWQQIIDEPSPLLGHCCLPQSPSLCPQGHTSTISLNRTPKPLLIKITSGAKRTSGSSITYKNRFLKLPSCLICVSPRERGGMSHWRCNETTLSLCAYAARCRVTVALPHQVNVDLEEIPSEKKPG